MYGAGQVRHRDNSRNWIPASRRSEYEDRQFIIKRPGNNSEFFIN